MNTEYKPRNAGAFKQPSVSKLEVVCAIVLMIMLMLFGCIVPVLVITEKI